MDTITRRWRARGRIDGGSASSFAAAAEAHLDDVYRYLLYMTRDPHLAEDLASATFERALSSWSRYDPRRGSELTFLCQLARTAALDHFRAEARRRRREERFASESDDAAPPPSETGEPFSPAVAGALATLSAADREIVALRVVLDVDPETAARILGISRTACSTRLNRALDKLKEKVTADALA